MHNLLRFLLKYAHFILFVALEIVGLILVIRNNEYPKSAFFSTANTVAAKTLKIENNVVSYFNLKDENRNLQDENTELRNLLMAYEGRMDSILQSDYILADKDLQYISARVINATTTKSHNYLTLNKGQRDGIDTDMGVVNNNGVIGIICAVSEHFSVVIPVINQSLSLSCKFNNTTGPLVWDTKDYRYAKLNDIARHIEVFEGDTVFTSGYTTVFPEGIMVGTIDNIKTSDSDAYHNISVRLAADFRNLGYVKVIKNNNQNEQKALESQFEE